MIFNDVIEFSILTACVGAIVFFRYGGKFSAINKNSALSRLTYIMKVLLVLGLVLSTLSLYQEGYGRFLRDLPNSMAFGFALALWAVWPLIKLGDEIRELLGSKQLIGLKVTLRGFGESLLVSIVASVGFVLIPNLFQGLFGEMFRFSDHYLSGSGNFGGLLAPFFSAGLIVGYAVLSFVLQFLFKLKRNAESSSK